MPCVGSAIAAAAAADATAVDCPLIDDDCWMTVATLLLTHTVRTPGFGSMAEPDGGSVPEHKDDASGA